MHCRSSDWPESVTDVMLRRALRFRRRGEDRRAMLMLREAAYRAPSEAKLWMHYAVACLRLGRRDEAAQALKQAVWIRKRANDEPRLRVTRALLERLLSGRSSLRLNAA
jgi:Tfp pilus assembly protein PilF